jgi:hypothetical protein
VLDGVAVLDSVLDGDGVSDGLVPNVADVDGVRIADSVVVGVGARVVVWLGVWLGVVVALGVALVVALDDAVAAATASLTTTVRVVYELYASTTTAEKVTAPAPDDGAVQLPTTRVFDEPSLCVMRESEHAVWLCAASATSTLLPLLAHTWNPLKAPLVPATLVITTAYTPSGEYVVRGVVDDASAAR